MAKFSLVDKLRVQTLREQGYGAKAIRSAYPAKNWSLNSLKEICRRVDSRGSAVDRKKGSGRPRTARTADNMAAVESLILSQEDKPGEHSSTRQIAEQLGISQRSVCVIAKADLNLSSFRRISGQVLTDQTKLKRLVRCKKLLRRCTVQKVKRMFFTDEKMFYLDPPVTDGTSCRFWSVGKKKNVTSRRLIRQRSKFSRSVMVSAGICFMGNGRLHFVPEKVKVNSSYYTEQLLPRLIDDCRQLMHDDFLFQQDGAPAHTSKQAQDWLEHHCPEFVNKDEWPPNSPDLNPLDFSIWGVMLDKYDKLSAKPKTTAELKLVLQQIWDSLSQEFIQKTVLAFRKRVQACVRSDGGHFEHLLS